MPKSLGDGHEKIAILTAEPVDPAAPTIVELAAGIESQDNILLSDYQFSATDSDKISEPAVGDVVNRNALGKSNGAAAFSFFRMLDETTKNAHATEDDGYQAVKAKGSRVWVYARKNGKLASAAWAAADEIRLGMELISDTPQAPSDQSGYIKSRVVFEPQNIYPEILAAAGP